MPISSVDIMHIGTAHLEKTTTLNTPIDYFNEKFEG
jgi:hypothetical protein